MSKTIPYTFYKEIDNMKVYRQILDDKYIIEFKEKSTSLYQKVYRKQGVN